MAITRQDLHRLAFAMRAAGVAIVLSGGAALLSPWHALPLARLGVGLASLLLGSFELSLATAQPARAAARQLLLTQGISGLAFGLLTLALPLLATSLALAAVIAWLALSAGLALRGAVVAWPVQAVARPLLAWGAVHAALLAVAVRHPGATVLAILFTGAAYATGLGAWLLVRGTLLRRRLRTGAADVARARLAAGLR